MPNCLYFECRALNNAMETMTTEITSFKNKLHALSKLEIDNKVIVAGYKKKLRDVQAELKTFETELFIKLEQWQPDLVKQVRSVVGIGKRATAILIVSTQGFKCTETYQQLISHAGLSSKEYSSGSSIRGRVRICKQGGSLLRHTLYIHRGGQVVCPKYKSNKRRLQSIVRSASSKRIPIAIGTKN